MSTDSQSSPPADIPRDIAQWRRKKLSIVVLLVATAIWVALEVYQFNFITVASWAAMFVVTLTFLWANILRLLNKEPSDLSWLEISEESAVEMAHLFRWWVESGVRWLFRVGAEGDCFTFAGTVAALWVASKVASYFDLLTLLYIGVVLGMTVPVIYDKYEDRIKGYDERFRMQCKRLYSTIDEKVFTKMKDKVGGQRKAKKTE